MADDGGKQLAEESFEPRFSWVPTDLLNRVRLGAYGALSTVVRRGKRPRYVFLQSHMRSGSTALTAVFAAHPEIGGHGELYLPYEKVGDLRAADGKVMVQSDRTWRNPAPVVVDKLLHEYNAPVDAPTLLAAADIEHVYLLRQPVPTVLSAAKRFPITEDEATDQIIERLEGLTARVQADHPSKPFALSYDQLTGQTDEILAALTEHLRLTAPLEKEYDTSARGKGDKSDTFAAGAITKRADDGARPTLANAAREAELDAAYQACVAAMNEHCHTLDGGITP